jgi:hypothetical protein
MRKRWTKRLLIILGFGTCAGVWALFGLHPYLAVNAPLRAPVAVVEGWIPAPFLPMAVEAIEQGGYQRVFVTGTVRSFSYYLDPDERLVVRGAEPLRGALRINVSGMPNAGFLLIADGDTVLRQSVTERPTFYHVHLAGADSLEVVSFNAGQAPEGMPNLYVKDLLIGSFNAHQLTPDVWRVLPDGTRLRGTPTFAELCAEELHTLGLAQARVVALPVRDIRESRTLSNATAFAQRARVEGITQVDVISLGVHARRSRKMFRKACGDAVQVGVIALPDPRAPADRWWRMRWAWVHLAKEVVGLPISSFFDPQAAVE